MKVFSVVFSFYPNNLFKKSEGSKINTGVHFPPAPLRKKYLYFNFYNCRLFVNKELFHVFIVLSRNINF